MGSCNSLALFSSLLFESSSEDEDLDLSLAKGLEWGLLLENGTAYEWLCS